ncbi:unnamed protein product [Chilo suppressalis]|uniref:C2H2-type domain-containing protein n=1 Tax=Chilo suppressalis TaxID=168631 RepID=A0ABN8BAZ2_CHISP|nr:unnamed protein product [Chilo suppressalis]
MESDGEIEYLDEDADIVQQCVQPPPPFTTDIVETPKFDESASNQTPLLVERRKSERKRKKKEKTEEHDSDYNPDEDNMPPSPPSPPATKKKKPSTRKSALYKPLVTIVKTVGSQAKSIVKTPEQVMLKRKDLDIRIPDYDDPLCLPVRAVRSIATDMDRLKKWNNACIEHLKHSDNLLKPERGQTKSSTRSVVLKNMIHKDSGRSETVIWTKTSVVNREGARKSELFQCVLPKFREKNTLDPINIVNDKKKKFHHKNEVVLTKEEHKGCDVLVAYNSHDTLSAVYKFDNAERVDRDRSPERCLREVASCRVCAPCYQASWRGTKTRADKKKLLCPICRRVAISVYNLLRHVRSHSDAEVRQHKRALSRALAQVVDYHYNCRICQKKLQSIKDLREHVRTHKGTTTFKCEIGNHTTT